MRKLIAGPSGYICDECVEFCVDIIREDAPIWKVLSVLSAADEQSENDAYPAASEHVRGRSTKDVASYVETSKQFVEHNRLALDCIRRRLAIGDGEVPAEDPLASRRFAYLNEKTRDELRDMQEETQRTLKRYEDALRIGTKVLGERKR